MRKKRIKVSGDLEDVVFMPALMPLEAAVLPAREQKIARGYGVLHMVRYACEAGDACFNQRAKIWVR